MENKESELVSIIIPVYNVEKYLRKSIESIINQTYKNIEIIIINDGSTDNSGSICEEYQKKDKRIKLINKENEGVSKARNIGLKEAKGKYITFIDSDDYVEKNYVQELFEMCSSHNVDMSICGTKDIYPNNKIRIPKKIKKILNSDKAMQELLLEEGYSNVIWAKMYKKELFYNIYFDEKTKIGEDLEVLFNIIKRCKFINVNTTKLLYNFNVRNDSATAVKFNKDWENEINIVNEIINKSKNLKFYKYTIRRYIRINISCITNIIKSSNDYNQIYRLRNNILKYKEYAYFKFGIKNKIKIFLIIYDIELYVKIVKAYIFFLERKY